MSAGPITIQLPTQPQPVQAVKSVNPATFIKQVSASQPSILQQQLTGPLTVNSSQSQLQPIKLTTTGYAFTQNGKFFPFPMRENVCGIHIARLFRGLSFSE